MERLPIGLAVWHMSPGGSAAFRLVAVNEAATQFAAAPDALPGKPMEEAFPELCRAGLAGVCAKTVESGRQPVEAELTCQTGQVISVQAFALPQQCVGTVLRSTAEIQQATEVPASRRRLGLEDANRTLRLLLRISRKLNKTLDLGQLLDRLAQEAVKLVDAAGGCAGLRKPEGMVSDRYFRNGKRISLSCCWPQGHGLPGWLLLHGRPYLSNEAARDQRISEELRDALGIKSVLSMPILDTHGKALGFFQVHNKKNGSGFTPADQEKLQALSWVAAPAIEKAQTFQRIQQAEEKLHQLSARLFRLQDDERRRIARELHDAMGQNLDAIALNLSVVSSHSTRLADRARRAIAENVSLVQQCSREVHNLSYLLYPPLLHELGLDSALRWFIDGFSRRSGIPVDLKVSAKLGRPATEVETSLFRIVQEALTNIWRHSGSPDATVRLFFRAVGITLEVRDHGRGMPADVLEKARQGVIELGMGMVDMEERARQIGGWLEIESGRRGTLIRVVVPRRRKR